MNAVTHGVVDNRTREQERPSVIKAIVSATGNVVSAPQKDCYPLNCSAFAMPMQ